MRLSLAEIQITGVERRESAEILKQMKVTVRKSGLKREKISDTIGMS